MMGPTALWNEGRERVLSAQRPSLRTSTAPCFCWGTPRTRQSRRHTHRAKKRSAPSRKLDSRVRWVATKKTGGGSVGVVDETVRLLFTWNSRENTKETEQ